jgi:hypothetical protein
MALTKITSKMTDDTIPQKTAHGAMKLPVGATGQRPTGEAGDLRYNSTTGEFEGYTTEWGSLGGSIDATHGSLTPTASSPADNTVVIDNYSSYSNPTFALFLGTTPLTFDQENNTLTITSYPQTGSQTITVRAAHGGGFIFSTVATVSVNIVNPAARYWRLTNWHPYNTSHGIRMGYLKMWTGLNGTGSAPASASGAYISANIWQYFPSYEYAYGPDLTRTLPFGGGYSTWNRTGSQVSASNWIKLDMQSPVLINSIDFAWTNNTVYYWATNMGLQKSYDDVNWIDVIHFGNNNGLPANTVNTNIATGSYATLQAGRNNVAQFNRTDEWAL